LYAFVVAVCPHAGGVGLCEMVQHLSVFDYICVSKTFDNRSALPPVTGVCYIICYKLVVQLYTRMTCTACDCDRVTEYIDHLHSHFVDPVVVKDGCYQVPQVNTLTFTVH